MNISVKIIDKVFHRVHQTLSGLRQVCCVIDIAALPNAKQAIDQNSHLIALCQHSSCNQSMLGVASSKKLGPPSRYLNETLDSNKGLMSSCLPFGNDNGISHGINYISI